VIEELLPEPEPAAETLAEAANEASARRLRAAWAASIALLIGGGMLAYSLPFLSGVAPWLMLAACILFSFFVLFTLITLPVEFDASNRAMAWLERSGIANQMEHDKAKNALFWAAMTYVAGAVGAIAQMLYWIAIMMGRRNE
jgi:Zn-dependent membrane protease YugP